MEQPITYQPWEIANIIYSFKLALLAQFPDMTFEDGYEYNDTYNYPRIKIIIRCKNYHAADKFNIANPGIKAEEVALDNVPQSDSKNEASHYAIHLKGHQSLQLLLKQSQEQILLRLNKYYSKPGLQTWQIAKDNTISGIKAGNAYIFQKHKPEKETEEQAKKRKTQTASAILETWQQFTGKEKEKDVETCETRFGKNISIQKTTGGLCLVLDQPSLQSLKKSFGNKKSIKRAPPPSVTKPKNTAPKMKLHLSLETDNESVENPTAKIPRTNAEKSSAPNFFAKPAATVPHEKASSTAAQIPRKK